MMLMLDRFHQASLSVAYISNSKPVEDYDGEDHDAAVKIIASSWNT